MSATRTALSTAPDPNGRAEVPSRILQLGLRSSQLGEDKEKMRTLLQHHPEFGNKGAPSGGGPLRGAARRNKNNTSTIHNAWQNRGLPFAPGGAPPLKQPPGPCLTPRSALHCSRCQASRSNCATQDAKVQLPNSRKSAHAMHREPVPQAATSSVPQCRRGLPRPLRPPSPGRHLGGASRTHAESLLQAHRRRTGPARHAPPRCAYPGGGHGFYTHG